jgi:hypothetical protein
MSRIEVFLIHEAAERENMFVLMGGPETFAGMWKLSGV